MAGNGGKAGFGAVNAPMSPMCKPLKYIEIQRQTELKEIFFRYGVITPAVQDQAVDSVKRRIYKSKWHNATRLHTEGDLINCAKN